MRLSVDNTGVHAVSRCLEGKGTSENDVDGLLQFATYLAFANHIVVNGFEPPAVYDETCAVRSYLIHRGLLPQDLEVTDRSRESYQKACDHAAETAAKRINVAFNPEPVFPDGLTPDLPERSKQIQRSFEDLVINPPSRSVIEDIRTTSLDDTASGACHYMLATSDDLRRGLAEQAKRNNWGRPEVRQLNAFLRVYLNQSLAEQRAAKYAPAVPRSRVMRKTSYTVAKRLSEISTEAAAEVRGSELPIPSVASVLVRVAEGDPERLLAAAIELRNSKPCARLRDWLEAEFGAVEPESLPELADFEETAVEIAHAVKVSLGPKKSRPSWASAIDTKIVFAAVPIFTIETKALLDWFRYHKTINAVAVLSDLSRQAAIEAGEQPLYEELVKRSTIKS